MPPDRPGPDDEPPADRGPLADPGASIDRETLAEWALALVAALPPAALAAGLVAGDVRGWVRWTAFLLVVAAPVAYALVAWQVYRRVGMFVEEFHRVVAFGGLAWVLGTATVAASLLAGGSGLLGGVGGGAGGAGGLGPIVVVLLAIGAGIFVAASLARRADYLVVRSVVLRSVAAQVAVVLLAGFPGSPVSAVAAWLGVALAPIAGAWWHRLAAG